MYHSRPELTLQLIEYLRVLSLNSRLFLGLDALVAKDKDSWKFKLLRYKHTRECFLEVVVEVKDGAVKRSIWSEENNICSGKVHLCMSILRDRKYLLDQIFTGKLDLNILEMQTLLTSSRSKIPAINPRRVGTYYVYWSLDTRYLIVLKSCKEGEDSNLITCLPAASWEEATYKVSPYYCPEFYTPMQVEAYAE